MSKLGNTARLALVSAAALACLATSAPRYRTIRAYPTWKVPPNSQIAVGCASTKTWISKSGKTGIGVSILVTSTEPCNVAIDLMRVEIDGASFEPPGLPPSATVLATSPVHFYLPLELENEALWNRSIDSGSLAITLRGGSEKQELRYAMKHSRPGPHITVPIHQPRANTQVAEGVRTVTPNKPSVPLEMVPGGRR